MPNCILVYDADCGPCTRFKNAIDFLDPSRKITFRSFGEADETGLLDRIPSDQRRRSFHVVTPDGTIYSASDGLAKAIELLPAGKVVSKAIESLPAGRESLRFLYNTLSRLHDGGGCSFNSVEGGILEHRRSRSVAPFSGDPREIPLRLLDRG